MCLFSVNFNFIRVVFQNQKSHVTLKYSASFLNQIFFLQFLVVVELIPGEIWKCSSLSLVIFPWRTVHWFPAGPKAKKKINYLFTCSVIVVPWIVSIKFRLNIIEWYMSWNLLISSLQIHQVYVMHQKPKKKQRKKKNIFLYYKFGCRLRPKKCYSIEEKPRWTAVVWTFFNNRQPAHIYFDILIWFININSHTHIQTHNEQNTQKDPFTRWCVINLNHECVSK